MKYIFVIGAGRSGTSWIAKVLVSSSSVVQYKKEPFSKMLWPADGSLREPWSLSANAPESSVQVHRNIIMTDMDESADFMLVKEVHNLPTFHRIVSGFDYKIVIVDRNPLRIVDSYFYNFSTRNNYVDEYCWLREAILDPVVVTDPLYKLVLERMPVAMLDYIKKPLSETEEYIRFFIIVYFCQVSLLTWNLWDLNTYIVRYDGLCTDSVSEFKRLFAFTGLKFNSNVVTFIASCRSSDERSNPYSIYRKDYIVGDAKFKYLTNERVDKLMELFNE